MLATIVIGVAQVMSSGPTVDYKPISVEGHGQTFEQAKESGFRQAIELQAGVLMLGERESKNYKLVKNDIYAHSAGYVRDFKVTNVVSSNGRYDVKMEVSISSTKFANRILTAGASTTDLPGNQFAAQASTYKTSKRQSDMLIERMMKKYPQQAYTISEPSVDLAIDVHRNTKLVVRYSMQWNEEYLNDLAETFKEASDSSRNYAVGKVAMTYKRTNGWWAITDKFYFGDTIPLGIMHKSMSNVHVQITVRNGDEVLATRCQAVEPLVDLASQEAVIYGATKLDYTAVLPEMDLENITNIDLKIADPKTCNW